MQKTLFSIASSLLVALLMCACSDKSSKTADSATVEADTVATLPESDGTVAIITNQGVGPVKCKTLVAEVRPSVENLYDTIIPEEEYEYTSYKFMLNGHERFCGYDFGDGIISVVSASDASVVASTPDGELAIGMPFTKVLSLKGVTPEFQSLDGEGMWCWIWQGLYFQPSQSQLPQRLSSKLYSAGSTPTVDDFDDNVTIEYIGTGMPY